MNEAVAFNLLCLFLGLMVLAVVLLVVRLTLLRTSKVTRWQKLCAEKGWTLTHQPTKNPQWQVDAGRWTVWYEEPLSEDRPPHLVFEAPTSLQAFKLLVLGKGRWERLKGKMVHGSRQAKDLNPFLQPSSTWLPVELATRKGTFVAFSNQPEVLQDLQGTLREALESLPGGQLDLGTQVQLEGTLRIQMDHLEWEEKEMLPLLTAGEALLRALQDRVTSHSGSSS